MTKSKCGLFFYKFCPCNIPYCTIKITSCSIQHAARTRRNYPDRSVQLVARTGRNYPDSTFKCAVIIGVFLSIHQNERKCISCIKMHATRIQNVIKPTSRATFCTNKAKLTRQCSVQLVARIRQNYPDNVRKSAVEK